MTSMMMWNSKASYLSSMCMMTMITLMGKGEASMGAIRKVRFQEKPDSIYRAVGSISIKVWGCVCGREGRDWVQCDGQPDLVM